MKTILTIATHITLLLLSSAHVCRSEGNASPQYYEADGGKPNCLTKFHVMTALNAFFLYQKFLPRHHIHLRWQEHYSTLIVEGFIPSNEVGEKLIQFLKKTMPNILISTNFEVVQILESSTKQKSSVNGWLHDKYLQMCLQIALRAPDSKGSMEKEGIVLLAADVIDKHGFIFVILERPINRSILLQTLKPHFENIKGLKHVTIYYLNAIPAEKSIKLDLE